MTTDPLGRLQAVVRQLRAHAPAEFGKGEFFAALDELGAAAEQIAKADQETQRYKQQLEQAQREVRSLRMRYQELFDFAPDGCLVTDAKAIIQEANHAAGGLLTRRNLFREGNPLGFFVAPAWRRAFYDALRTLNGQDNGFWWKTCFQQPGPPPRFVAISVTAIPDGEAPVPLF